MKTGAGVESRAEGTKILAEVPQTSTGGTQARRAQRALARHIPALDGLRGLAIFSVFLLHYGGGGRSQSVLVQAFGFVCSLGGAGLTLFFSLSGFLITGLLWDAREEPRWLRNFYIRRALRIMPLYYGTLLLLLLWPAFDSRYHFKDAATVAWVHALYLQNVPRYNSLWKGATIPFFMEHYWSLAVEEQFYLVWPFLLLLTKTLRQAVFLCFSVFLGCFLFRFLAPNASVLQHSLPSNAGPLALGGAVAFAYRSAHWPAMRRWLGSAALLAGIVFMSERLLRRSARSSMLWDTIDLLVTAILCAGLIGSVVDPGRLQRVASVAWLRWLGTISYGVYIFHWLPVFGYNWLTQRLSGHSFDAAFFALRMLIVIAPTLLIARLSFRFYEKPFLRLKSRLAPHAPR